MRGLPRTAAAHDTRTVDGSYNDLENPAHGNDRRALWAQRAPRSHPARGASRPARPEPAPRQPRAAHARRLQGGDDRQRARRSVAPVRGPRLVQPRQEPAGGAVRDRAGRQRPMGRPPDADRPDAARPVARRKRRGRNVGDHRLALVGRLADLRLRPRSHRGPARRRGRPASTRSGRAAPPRPRRQARPHRRSRQLLARPCAPAHAVHARAQRNRRPPRAGAAGMG